MPTCLTTETAFTQQPTWLYRRARNLHNREDTSKSARIGKREKKEKTQILPPVGDVEQLKRKEEHGLTFMTTDYELVFICEPRLHATMATQHYTPAPCCKRHFATITDHAWRNICTHSPWHGTKTRSCYGYQINPAPRQAAATEMSKFASCMHCTTDPAASHATQNTTPLRRACCATTLPLTETLRSRQPTVPRRTAAASQR